MKYLDRFDLVDEEGAPDFVKKIKYSYSEDEWFPLGFFSDKKLSRVDFETVTVFYGGNGSGKSTLLNLIAEKLALRRTADVSVTKAFGDFADYCKAYKTKIPVGSKMLTSEDVFQNIFSTRSKNIAIDEQKAEEEDFFDELSFGGTFDEFADTSLISKRLVKKQHLSKKTKAKERQFSNGENALKFFKGEIQKKKLYLLDEPENSMSPAYQLELKTLLEESAKFDGCQFIIATHSPFILSIEGAQIYNLDATPVSVEKWYNLKNMRVYYDFFAKHKDLFEMFRDAVPKKKAAKK
ncbi:MAG: AAA family ATPase [Firmicutes bacterium]|nr:AAA family ATPase [Bacillota bacterium]